MKKGEKRGGNFLSLNHSLSRFSLSLVCAFVIFGILASSINPLRNILISDVHPGEHSELRASIVNEFGYDLKDLNLVAQGMDIDLYAKAAPFDIDGKSTKAKLLILPVDKSVKPGEYLLKLTLSNDKIKKIKYRYINII